MGYIILGAFLLIIFIVIIANIKIVPQAQAYVVERLGAYHQTFETGVHLTIPIIDRVARKVSLKETGRIGSKREWSRKRRGKKEAESAFLTG